MAEIILSLFAIIGMMFFIVYICDFIFYHKYHHTLTLTIDTRTMSTDAIIDTFELINTVRQTTSGKALISYLLVLVSDFSEEKAKISREYMRIFHIKGKIEVPTE